MKEFNPEYDAIWHEVGHEVEAYRGYPDVQEHILQSALEESKSGAVNLDVVPVAWRAAFSEPHGEKKLAEILLTSPHNHFMTTLEALKNGVEFDELAIKMTVEAFRKLYWYNAERLQQLDRAVEQASEHL